jgi:HSP20 family molecular chaperone IbpA
MSTQSKKSGREDSLASSEMSFLQGTGWNVTAACIEPLYDMMVGAAEVVLTIDLPYVDQKQVKLACPADDVLEIHAETTRKITFKDLGIKHRHGEFTCYHARIRTPVPVDEANIKTRFKRGVLEVHVPRMK